MFIKFLFCAFLVSLLSNVQSARILAIIPTPSFSHQIPFRPLWRELANRGHEVTLLTTDPMNDPKIKEVDWHGAYKFWEVSDMVNTTSINPLNTLMTMAKQMENAMKYELNHPEVQTILNNKTEHFDLVISEVLMPNYLAFGHRFNCPTIGIVSMDAPSYIHTSMGNAVHSALYPEMILPFSPPLEFFQRFVSFISTVGLFLLGYIFQNSQLVLMEGYFGKGVPTTFQLINNISMLFTNTNPLFQPIRPLGPATIQIGGGAHFTPPKPLPKDLEDFLNGAKEGAIYFSLGTNVKYANIDKPLLEVFLNTFKDLPYRVLWKLDAEIPNPPKNVKIIPWGPQQDILRHPNVKLFIMQGGLQSTEEAIFQNVPIIVIPFFADQQGNAKLIKNKGFGVMVDRHSVTKDILTETISQVMKNPKYRETTKKYAQLAVDQPMTGLEKAVWWTEYVIRHKGAPHLKNDYKIPGYQYYHLDVIAFISSILFIFVFVTYKLLKFVAKRIFALFVSKPKTKVD